MTTAREYADMLDHATPDHFPTCPHCGNVCGRLASKCADCGCKLYPTHLALQQLGELGSAAMRRRKIAALVREDREATREKGD